MAQPHPNYLKDARVLIFGGSSGIGFATASAALANGSKVHISSSNPEKQAAVIKKLQGLYPGSHVSGTPADLSDRNTIDKNVKNVLDDAIRETGGPLNHIAYTAGGPGPRIALKDADPATLFDGWAINVLGPMMIGKHIAANPGKYVAPEVKSSITLTSGVLVHKPLPGMSATIPGAGAKETLSTALAVDLAPIRVNTIAPGLVLTELLANWGKEVIDGFTQKSLTKEAGLPAGAAEAYLFCMRSPLATGQIFNVENGYLLS